MNSKHENTRPGEIWLVHHTHVDIGYTEPQDIILRKHAEFIARALDYCTATDDLPTGERFCWTCEVSWTVKTFLSRYPERAEEFFRRVREGRIEVTALYLQLTDLFTLELLEETTDYAVQLGRKNGFEVVTAMNDDVNGWSWGLPDLLAARGVRYMDTAINQTRALGVKPRPALFKWTGPRNGSLFFWHSDGYMSGNGLGFDKPGADERVAAYLERFEKDGYPHNVVEMRIQGRSHDNAPPGLWLCDMARLWNSAHPAGPRLRLVTSREWFENASANWPAPVVTHRAGWPDWWADGNGSAAAESALVRRAQADLVTLDSLAAATGQAPAVNRAERARDAAAFFCEHTWGAWCSTDQPNSLTSKAQWNTKASFAYTAAVESESLVKDMLTAQAVKQSDRSPGVLVFNPCEVRSDIVELLAADADLGLSGPAWVPAPVRTEPGPAFHMVDEERGALVPVWREPAIADSARRPAQRIRFLARDLPARGFCRYRVVAGEAEQRFPHTTPPMEISTDERGITAIRDGRDAGDWFAAADDGYRLGEVIYETIPSPHGREKLCGWTGIKRDCPFERTSLCFGPSEPLKLPYGHGLRLAARDLPGSLRALTIEFVTYDDLPWLDIFYRLDKLPNPEAEAIYVAFPLGLKTEHRTPNPPCVHLDIPGATMRPGLDQVPGTATDWHGIQHYFAVESAGRTMVVASPDIPLVQINGINTGLWQETLPPHNGLVMSWVMNNYWFTNFPAEQGGELTWRYRLSAMPGQFDPEAVGRLARAACQPPVGAVTDSRE